MITLAPVKVAFERILVPTDFSDTSERALRYAKSIAREYQSQLFVVHVNQPINPITPPEAVWIDQEGIQQQLEQQLEQEGAALRSEGFQARGLSVTGAIHDEILSLIKENRIDLIVMGTHGRRGLNRLMFGSDAETVLRQASCPVLIIGPEVAPATDQSWHPKNVICATTFDSNFAWVAAYAYRFAVQCQAQFLLFNIGNPGPTMVDKDWLLFEDALKHHLGGLGADISLRTLLSGNLAGQKIVDVAKEYRADLIIMAARAASSIATHLASGTVPQVFAEAPCPVMTLHQ